MRKHHSICTSDVIDKPEIDYALKKVLIKIKPGHEVIMDRLCL
ncbi:hypothetical protein ACM6Q7_21485 [Peribacillus butanolivorans]